MNSRFKCWNSDCHIHTQTYRATVPDHCHSHLNSVCAMAFKKQSFKSRKIFDHKQQQKHKKKFKKQMTNDNKFEYSNILAHKI